jgi:two-component system NtrC family sensor kinase
VGRRWRVLIVDSTEAGADQIVHALQRSGHDPQSKRVDTLEALNVALKQADWDVILMDEAVPALDIAPVWAQVTDRPVTIPVILISSGVDEDRLAALLEADAVDYVLRDQLPRLAPAIKRALREAAMQHEVAERTQAEAGLQALQRVSLNLNKLMATTELLRLIVEQAVELLGAVAGGVYIYDVPRHVLVFEIGVGYTAEFVGWLQKPGEGLAGRAFSSGRAIVAGGYAARSASSSNADKELHLVSQLCAPLLGRQSTLGVLMVSGSEDQDFDEHAVWLAEMFAAQAAVTLENARLHAETERRAKELTALYRASQAITSSLDSKAVLNLVLNETKSLLNTGAISIALRDPTSDELVFAAVSGLGAEKLIGTHLPPQTGIAGWVMREGQSVLISEAQTDPRFYRDIDARLDNVTRSVIAVPLKFKGVVLGVVEAINKATGLFDQHDLEILEALAASASIAIENARLYKVERDQFQRLQESQARLVQVEKTSALGRLTASIAHEINNPLQAVSGCLSLIKEELDETIDPDDLRHILTMADDEINRIALIVGRLREFFRPSRDGLRATDVQAVLQNVLELTRKQLQHASIAVQAHWAENVAPIHSNPDHLKQVFLNLILNAVDAMPNGGALDVAVTLDQISSQNGAPPVPAVCIEFKDTGAGIPADVLPRIFEPFFTTKDTGTGLGLSISYEIIQSLKGEITVTSQEQGGTIFTIRLPAAPA